MVLFGKSKANVEAERAAMENEAAAMARIASVTLAYRAGGPPAPVPIPLPTSAMAAPQDLAVDPDAPPVWVFDEGEDTWPPTDYMAPSPSAAVIMPNPAGAREAPASAAAWEAPPARPAPPEEARAPAAPSRPAPGTAAALIADNLLEETSKHLRSIGTVNILVAGQTGVGKSTLVNSVFGEDFARAAAGRPVTEHAEWYSSDTVPLRILDTRGLEAKDYAGTLGAMRAEIEASRAEMDERNQLHIGWVCIAAPSSRVQDCELDIVRLLNMYDIPAVIVLTKEDDDEEFAYLVADIMRQQNCRFTAIVRTRAIKKTTRPPFGLADLVTATFAALPEAHRAAFAAAQKINLDLNRATAEGYVSAAASAAAAASAIPIPFADVATLAPTQAAMLVGISNAFGLSMDRAQVVQLITTALGCMAMVMAGGWAVGTVLKFIPGPGSVIGAVVNATVAGGLTRALGRAYIRFLCQFIEQNGRLPSNDEIFGIFPAFYKAGRKRVAA